MNGNWVDLILVLIIAFYVWQGWERGIFTMITEVISWVGAIWAGVKLSGGLGRILVTYFGIGVEAADLIALYALVIVVWQVIYWGLREIVVKIPRQYFPGWLQVPLGLLPAAISGTLIVAFVVLVLMRMPFNYPVKSDIQESLFGQVVGTWAETL